MRERILSFAEGGTRVGIVAGTAPARSPLALSLEPRARPSVYIGWGHVAQSDEEPDHEPAAGPRSDP